MPGESVVFGLFNADRRDLAEHAADPPGGPSGPRVVPSGRAGRRPGRSRHVDRPMSSPTPGHHRRAPGRGSTGRHGHDHAVSTWSSRWPRPSGSTASSPPGTASNDGPTTARSTASSCGARASCGRCDGGPTPTAWTSAPDWAYSDSFYDLPLLCRGRTPGRSTPTPGCGPWRLRCAGGRITHFDVPAGRAPVLGHRAPDRRSCRSPARVVPLRPVRHRRRRPNPCARTGHHRRQPPQLLRSGGHGGDRGHGRGRPVRLLGKKEVFDAPVVGALVQADGRHPGRSGHRFRRAAPGGRVRRWGPASWWRIMPQGTIPRGPAFFDPELKGRWGAARLAGRQRRARHAGRDVGHRAGLASQRGFPDVANMTDPPDVRVRVGAPVDLAWRRS